jgi:Transposase
MQPSGNSSLRFQLLALPANGLPRRSRGRDTRISGTDEEVIVPRRYPVEFRRKVLDLIEAGRPVVEIAAQLGVSDQTIYNWRKQDRIVPDLGAAGLRDCSGSGSVRGRT